MDFYEALMKYEDIFGNIVKKNLEKFKKKLIEIIENNKNNENKINENNDIENINMKEIIKEIESSNKLKQIIQLKYKSLKKNKCIIFAKDIKRRHNRNYNNQKKISNHDVTIEFNEEIEKEIKERIKNNIKEKFLNELNKQINNNYKNSTQNHFSKFSEKKINYSITESNLSKSRDSRNLIPLATKRKTFKDKLQTQINITKSKKSVNHLNFNSISPKNENIILNRNLNFLKNNIITEENKNELNKKINIRNIKIFDKNKEKNENKNKENRPYSNNKKIEISKFKIGNNENKVYNNNKNVKKIQMVKIRARPDTNPNINDNKIKINFKGKRILSSRMVIKEEELVINNSNNLKLE